MERLFKHIETRRLELITNPTSERRSGGYDVITNGATTQFYRFTVDSRTQTAVGKQHGSWREPVPILLTDV
jgi:hypothetical protein